MLRVIHSSFWLVFCLFLSVNGYGSDNNKIIGTVSDEQGQPLPGATVVVQQTQRGAITGIDGTFEIDAKINDILEVSYLGYQTQLITVVNFEKLTIKLVPSANEMEEVVVTAFGRQKKESLVGSIDAVSTKELKTSSSNLTSALAGRVPGIIGFQRSGHPGADNAQFFVRGVTSFGYAQNPLIMLDGFEIDANTLARLDPDNIEQFSVLKDATAAALYGSRGANGVIAITTKQGREGPAKIFFRHESRISMPTCMPEFVDGVEFMNLYNQAYLNDNPQAGVYYSSQKIYNTQIGKNPYVYPNVDWQAEMFKRYAYNHYYTMSVSGGGHIARYYVSASYNHDNGILRRNPESTHDFNSNIAVSNYSLVNNTNIQLTKTTRLDLNFNSGFQSYNGPNANADQLFLDVVEANPVDFPKYYAKTENTLYLNRTLFGNAPGTAAKANPYANMVTGSRETYTADITAQVTLSQDFGKFIPGLSLQGKMSIYNHIFYSANRYYVPYYYNIKSYNEQTDTYELEEIFRGNDKLGDLATDRNSLSRTYLEGSIRYERTFGKHDVSGLVLYTQESERNLSGKDVLIRRALPHRTQAIRARVTYGYDGRYLAELSMAYQGSEAFAPKHRWGLFPSIGVGYMISQERFWEPLKKVVNRFKFRVSYGLVGNDQMDPAQRFFFLSDINVGGRSYPFGETFTQNYYGYTINRFANPNITWEKSYKQNYGIDLSLFNMADIQIDYFREHRTNIYQARTNLPFSMGMTATEFGNIGEVKVKGVDGSLDIKKQIGTDFFLTGRFNFTYAVNKTTVIDEPAYKDPYLKRAGYHTNQIHGYIAERLFIDQADIDNSPVQMVGNEIVRPGDIKYKDRNGDGIVDKYDVAPIGFPTVPEFTYGFGTSVTWKGFDFSFFFQGTARTSFFIGVDKVAPLLNRRNVLKAFAADHWNPNNPVAQTLFPRLSTTNNANNYYPYSTWWLRDGSFLRLKSVEIGYTLPKKVTDRLRLDMVRIYASGQNLAIFSKFDLWDAEMGSNGFAYPLQKVYNLGININF